jgi:cytochrome c biogenesis protein CcdA
MLTSLLGLGLLLGVRHALEADHVAAVAAMATRARSSGEAIRMATFWGCGHALALVALGGAVAALGASLPEPAARALEAAAGLVLAGLGVDVLRRLDRRRVHFHPHRHDDGVRHLHAHAHDGEPAAAHDPARHDHAHARGTLARALLVGGVHGLAGSGALVVLALQSAGSPGQALAYVFVFGAGSVLGMVLFSTAVALPLRIHASHLSRTARGLEAALGLASVALGLWIAVRAGVGPLG